MENNKKRVLEANEMDTIGFVKVMYKICVVTPDMYEDERSELRAVVDQMSLEELHRYAALGLNAYSVFKNEYDKPEMKTKMVLSDIAYEMSQDQTAKKSEGEDEYYAVVEHNDDVMYG